MLSRWKQTIALVFCFMLPGVYAQAPAMPGMQPTRPPGMLPPQPPGAPPIPTGAIVHQIPRADVLQEALFLRTSMYPPGFEFKIPISPWVQKEKERFAKVLAFNQSDLFIAPIQVQANAFDRSTRSRMFAELSALIARSGQPALHNPYAVQRALGEGVRTSGTLALSELAKSLNAKQLLVVYVGHDGNQKMLVTVELRARGNDAVVYEWPIAQRGNWTYAFTAGEEAVDILMTQAAPHILEMLKLSAIALPPAKAADSPIAFPKTPAELFAMAERGPLQEAAAFQILGMLAPDRLEHVRSRFFEQSLVALRQMPETGEAARLFAARAHFYLNSRPAALAALGKPASPQARAFAALLNGNLAEMEKATKETRDELQRVFLEFELIDLRRDYEAPVEAKMADAVITLARKAPEWQRLLTRRLGDKDRWQAQPNTDIKYLLDRTFPIKGFDIETLARGLYAFGKDIDEEDLGLKAFEHINRIRETDAKLWSCFTNGKSCVRAGYLDLMEALAVSNACKTFYMVAWVQGLEKEGAAYVRKVSPVLDGQPAWMFALLQVSQGRQAPLNFMKQQETGLLLGYLEQGQSRIMNFLGSTSAGSMSMPMIGAYNSDLPVRYYWSYKGLQDQNLRLADVLVHLDYSYDDLTFIGDQALEFAGDKLERLKQQLTTRFRGNPLRTKILAQTKQGDDVDDKIAALKETVLDRPDVFRPYYDLGALLIAEKGDYKAATELFLSYPGFKNPAGYPTVELGNDAYAAGSLFYWRGRIEGARKLYRLSADVRTGSATSMVSESRLLQFDGRYEEAAQLSLQRARRYESEYAYRDSLAWLFVLGKRDDAWAGFAQVATSFTNPQVWHAALTGKRIEKRTWPELKEWLLSTPIRTATSKYGAKPALLAALLLNTVDRKLADDLVETMKAIETEPPTTIQMVQIYEVDPNGGSPRPVPNKQDIQVAIVVDEGASIFEPSLFRRDARPPYTNRKGLPSHWVMFAEAYAALHRSDFESAVKKFDEMSGIYPLEGNSRFEYAVFALPYFAWAAGKTGDKLGLEKFLVDSVGKERRGFDYYMALAFFAGLRGENDKAVNLLNQSFNRIPYTDFRPVFVEFQWAEACESLFDATRDKRFRDMALNWAKLNQKINPTHSWSYAMEAKYTASESDRLRALGIALYLDPLSLRASAFPEDVKQKARKNFEVSNPFKSSKERPRGNAQTA